MPWWYSPHTPDEVIISRRRSRAPLVPTPTTTVRLTHEEWISSASTITFPGLLHQRYAMKHVLCAALLRFHGEGEVEASSDARNLSTCAWRLSTRDDLMPNRDQNARSASMRYTSTAFHDSAKSKSLVIDAMGQPTSYTSTIWLPTPSESGSRPSIRDGLRLRGWSSALAPSRQGTDSRTPCAFLQIHPHRNLTYT